MFGSMNWLGLAGVAGRAAHHIGYSKGCFGQEGAMSDQSRFVRMAQGKPSDAQLRYLRRGLRQPGGKLPLFDEHGQQISPHTIESCVKAGWAEPWFENPIKPDWLVCKLTSSGRALFDIRQ
jgi:hypothetical protein